MSKEWRDWQQLVERLRQQVAALEQQLETALAGRELWLATLSDLEQQLAQMQERIQQLAIDRDFWKTRALNAEMP